MKDNKLAHALEMQKYIDQNMNNRPNPFDSGIMRAIQSSKASVKMDDDQRNRATTKSLLAFGRGLEGQPKRRGLLGNLAVGARAIGPALEAYHGAEDQAEEENQKRLQYAQTLRAQDEAKAMHFEQQAYSRDMADKQMAMHQAQLAEQRQHHREMMEVKNNKIQADKHKYASGGQFDPIMSAGEHTKIANQKRVAASVNKEVREYKKEYDDFEKFCKQNDIPMDPYHLNNYVRIGMDTVSGFRNNQTDRELASRYASLRMRGERLAMQFEQADKQRGLTDFTVKYANSKELFPKVSDMPNIFNAKIKNMIEDTDLSLSTLDASLRTGMLIDKSNYDSYLNSDLYGGERKHNIHTDIIPLQYNDGKSEIEKQKVVPDDANQNTLNIIEVFDPQGKKYNIPLKDFNNLKDHYQLMDEKEYKNFNNKNDQYLKTLQDSGQMFR